MTTEQQILARMYIDYLAAHKRLLDNPKYLAALEGEKQGNILQGNIAAIMREIEIPFRINPLAFIPFKASA